MEIKTKKVTTNLSINCVSEQEANPSVMYAMAEVTNTIPACEDPAGHYYYYVPTDHISFHSSEPTFWKMYVTFDVNLKEDQPAYYDYFGSNQTRISPFCDAPKKIEGLNLAFIKDTYFSLFSKPVSMMDIPSEFSLTDADIPFMRNTNLIFDEYFLKISQSTVLTNYNFSLEKAEDEFGTVLCAIPFNHMFGVNYPGDLDETDSPANALQNPKDPVPLEGLLKEIFNIESQEVWEPECNRICQHSSFNFYGGSRTSESFNFANQPAGLVFCSAPEVANREGVAYCSFFNRESSCSFFSPIQEVLDSTDIKLHSGDLTIELHKVPIKDHSGAVTSQYQIFNSSNSEVITHINFQEDTSEEDKLSFAKDVYADIISSYTEEKQTTELEQDSEDKNSSYILSVIGGV